MSIDIEQRLIDIEIAISNQQKTIDELDEVVASQANTIDKLKQQITYLINASQTNNIKPLSEETTPPHY